MTAAPTAVPALMYHEITAASPAFPRLAVTPAAFAAQLAHLSANGFTTLTAGQAAAALAGPTTMLPDRSVVLTFDDGFRDFYDAAVPLLRRHGFTATLFMTTGWIADAKVRAPSIPGRMLSWGQLREIADAGIEIGAHSDQHPQLDQLGAAVLRHELAASKAILEDGLGRPVPGLAYPFGYSSAKVRLMASQLGYSYAQAVGNRLAGSTPDMFALPRLTVHASTSMPTFSRVAVGSGLAQAYLADRAMTKGWAVIRRARAAARSPRHD